MCFFFLFLLLNGNIFTIIIALHRFLCIRLCFVGINVVELTTSFIINFAWLFGLIGHLCVGGHRSQWLWTQNMNESMSIKATVLRTTIYSQQWTSIHRHRMHNNTRLHMANLWPYLITGKKKELNKKIILNQQKWLSKYWILLLICFCCWASIKRQWLRRKRQFLRRKICHHMNFDSLCRANIRFFFSEWERNEIHSLYLFFFFFALWCKQLESNEEQSFKLGRSFVDSFSSNADYCAYL